MGAGKIVQRGVVGAVRGVAGSHAEKSKAAADRAAEQAIDQNVAASVQPGVDPDTIKAAGEIIQAGRRGRTREALIKSGATLGGLAMVGGAIVFAANKCSGGVHIGLPVHTAITQEQIGSAVTGVKVNTTTPVATVEAEGSATVVHAKTLFGWQMPFSGDPIGARVLAQGYNNRSGRPVPSGLEVYAQPNAITLSGRTDPSRWWTDPNTHKREHSPQMVATINSTGFGGDELANPRDYVTSSGSDNLAFPWMLSDSGQKPTWYVQEEGLAVNRLETAAVKAAPGAIPAGVAEQVKKWTKLEAGVLKGKIGAKILMRMASPKEPVLLRFVSIDQGGAEDVGKQQLVNPSNTTLPVASLSSEQNKILHNGAVTTSTTYDTLAAGQQLNQLEHEPGLFRVAGFPNWSNQG